MTNPYLAITLGDPAGISYEIVCRAVNSLTVKRICGPVVFGNKQVVNNILPKYFKGRLPFK
jgi:4-hydroxythreonine-4-phosphate dehydrogenase